MAKEITDANISELLKGDKPLVVDFWAEWCGPCRALTPFIEELAEEYADRVVIGKMNVDENEDTPVEYSVRNIPTVLFFKDGELKDKSVGFVSKAILEEKIKALL